MFAAKKSALKMRYCSAQGAVRNISIATVRVLASNRTKLSRPTVRLHSSASAASGLKKMNKWHVNECC